MKSHWKYIVVSLIIGWFIGAASGLIGMRCYRHGGFNEKPFGRMRDRLYKELKLSPEQRTQVDTIMKASREKMEAVRTTARDQIRQKLTPEQQAVYDAANTRMDARRQRRMENRKKWHD